MMKLTYKQKLQISVTSLFFLFAILLVAYEIRQERDIKRYAIESRLDAYARILACNDSYEEMAEHLFPAEMRTTVLDTAGNVLYDSKSGGNDNHLKRPEVIDALKRQTGCAVRKSGTTGLSYFYYARNFDDRIIRVALPYDTAIRQFFQIDDLFIIFVLLLLMGTICLLALLSDYFGKGVTHLLKLHIRNSEKGVAVFSPCRKQEYSNPKFVQYLTVITGCTSDNCDALWDDGHFQRLKEYLDQADEHSRPFSYAVEESGRIFRIQTIIYPDMGFEVGIVDITSVQENNRLKQQMTSNISHELRTPVTSIRGYLETMIACPDIPPEKRNRFMERAYQQTIRLSDLIRDMALISKIEESSGALEKETVDLRALSVDVFDEFQEEVRSRKMTVRNLIGEGLELYANKTLLYAVLRNLVENSVKYAGNGALLHFECYSQKEDFLYFTYYDTGEGVEERHLVKLFERFYRVGEGRSRDTGGSGLGLSIVRNAVVFHGGEINVTNRESGGLQFFFSLRKV